MSYESFQEIIGSIVRKSGGGISVDFDETETGKYVARVSDGTTITGNSLSKRVTVRWGGRNHQAQAALV